MIYWTACNNNSHLDGCRQATTLRAAVRAARKYAREVMEDYGTIKYFDGSPSDENDRPVRIDTRRFAGEAWDVTERSAR